MTQENKSEKEKSNVLQQHLRKPGTESGNRQVRASWLPLSLADRKELRKAPRFFAAKRDNGFGTSLQHIDN